MNDVLYNTEQFLYCEATGENTTIPVIFPSLSPVSSRVELEPSSVFAEYAKEYGSGAGCDSSPAGAI